LDQNDRQTTRETKHRKVKPRAHKVQTKMNDYPETVG